MELDCNVDLKVYKPDKEELKWVWVKYEIDDRLLSAGDNCSFSVSPHDFQGLKRKCVYAFHSLVRPNCRALKCDIWV